MPLTNEQRELVDRLSDIFFSYGRQHAYEYYGAVSGKPTDGSRALFIHYTSAEAAIKIIRNKEFWMRNTTCMDDFSEVEHGFGMVRELISKRREELTSALDACHPGTTDEILKAVDQDMWAVRNETFIACLSEFNEKIDTRGKLSMWRAFKKSAATVGMVFSIPWQLDAAIDLGISFVPVTYMYLDHLSEQFAKVIENIKANEQFLKQIDRNVVIACGKGMLINALVSVKDKCFEEENEWRVVLTRHSNRQLALHREIEVINGIPQPVLKLPLRATRPELNEFEFASFFHGLIIGPTQYPSAMAQAFVHELTIAGVQNPSSKITVSNIPLRA